MKKTSFTQRLVQTLTRTVGSFALFCCIGILFSFGPPDIENSSHNSFWGSIRNTITEIANEANSALSEIPGDAPMLSVFMNDIEIDASAGPYTVCSSAGAAPPYTISLTIINLPIASGPDFGIEVDFPVQTIPPAAPSTGLMSNVSTTFTDVGNDGTEVVTFTLPALPAGLEYADGMSQIQGVGVAPATSGLGDISANMVAISFGTNGVDCACNTPNGVSVDVTDAASDGSLEETICHDTQPTITLNDTDAGTDTVTDYFEVTSASTNATGATAGPTNITLGSPIETASLTSTDGLTVGTVTYTVTPMSNGPDGATGGGDDCLGTAFMVVVTVEPEPKAIDPADETICSGDIPAAVIDVTAIDGHSFKVTTVTSGSNITGASASPYNLADAAQLEENALVNTGATDQTVVYTVQPYTNGADEADNDATGDDCLGTTFTVTITVQPTPEATATDDTAVSGTDAFDEVICSGSAPTGKFDLVSGTAGVVTAVDYGDVTVSGTAVAVNAILADAALFDANTLTNNKDADITVTYTVCPYTNGPDGADNSGMGDDCVAMVGIDDNDDTNTNGMGSCVVYKVIVQPTPEATATDDANTSGTDAFQEVICSGSAPTGKFDLVSGTAGVVTAVDYGDVTVSGTAVAADAILADAALFDANMLINATTADITVTYTVCPYTNGPDGTDDSGMGDDCIATAGAPNDNASTTDGVGSCVVYEVIVQPAPEATATDDTAVSGTDAFDEVICSGSAPTGKFDLVSGTAGVVTAVDYGDVTVSGTAVAVNAILADAALFDANTLTNNKDADITVTYTVCPYTNGPDGADNSGMGDDCVAMVGIDDNDDTNTNGMGSCVVYKVIVQPTPESTATDDANTSGTDAFQEVICSGSAPTGKFDLVSGTAGVVTAVDYGDVTVSGTAVAADAILADAALFDANMLINATTADITVKYTVCPYTNGPDGTDDSGMGDDCIATAGAPNDNASTTDGVGSCVVYEVIVQPAPEATATDDTAVSGTDAFDEVICSGSAPTGKFDLVSGTAGVVTAVDYGDVTVSGTAVAVNAILADAALFDANTLTNNKDADITVTYTVCPYTNGPDGADNSGMGDDCVAMVGTDDNDDTNTNGMGSCVVYKVIVQPTPEATATDDANTSGTDAFQEVICSGSAPTGKFDLVAGTAGVVTAVDYGDVTVSGTAVAVNAILADAALFDANMLINATTADITVKYTVCPYTNGPDGTDDSGMGDDCIATAGAPNDNASTTDGVGSCVVYEVIVQPAPEATATDDTAVSGTDAFDEVICSGSAPTGAFDLVNGTAGVVTAVDYGDVTVSGTAVAVNAILADAALFDANMLINATTADITVKYTVCPYTNGPDGNDDKGNTVDSGDGILDDCLATAGTDDNDDTNTNGMGSCVVYSVVVQPTPETTATDDDGNSNILTESICSGQAAATKVDVVAPAGGNAIVTTIVAGADITFTGTATAMNDILSDGDEIEGATTITNNGAAAQTVVYTVCAYTNGPDENDDMANTVDSGDGILDDCIASADNNGATADGSSSCVQYTLTVEPAPEADIVDGGTLNEDGDNDAHTEVVCSGDAPVATLDIVVGDNAIVTAVNYGTVTPSGAPVAMNAIIADNALIDANVLTNTSAADATVTYTICPYTFGTDTNDDGANTADSGDGILDDCVATAGATGDDDGLTNNGVGSCVTHTVTVVPEPDVTIGTVLPLCTGFAGTQTYEIPFTITNAAALEDIRVVDVVANAGGSTLAGANGILAAISNDLTDDLGTTGTVNTTSPVTIGIPATTPAGTYDITIDFGNQRNSTALAVESAANPFCKDTEVVTIEVRDCTPDISIADPCECLNDAGVNMDNGTFREVVVIKDPLGGILPSNMTWTVTSLTGGFLPNGSATEGSSGTSAVTIGGASAQLTAPANYCSTLGGCQLDSDPDIDVPQGAYFIQFEHVDAAGYAIEIQGPDPTIGTATNQVLSISNTCFYPDVQIFGPTELCVSDAAVTYQATPTGTGTGVWGGDASFLSSVGGYNQVVQTGLTTATGEFDPAIAGPGNHKISYVYNGDDSGFNDPGCITVLELDVTVLATPIITAVITDETCGNGMGAITITDATTGSITNPVYSWTDPTGAAVIGTTSLTTLSHGCYTVMVTGDNICAKSFTFCVGQNNPDIGVTGVVTDDNSCSSTLEGAIDLTVTPAGTYSFAWSGPTTIAANTEDPTMLAAGAYSVTVSNGTSGCTAVAYFDVDLTDNDVQLTVTAEADPTCNGGTGSVTVQATGGTDPYDFAWSSLGTAIVGDIDGEITETLLTAGVYTVTVTDASGCTSIETVEIEQPAAALAVVVASKTDVSCNGLTDGTITLSASGGTPGYTYSITAGAAGTSIVSGNVITGLDADTYTVTATDANLCATTVSVTIGEPTVLTVAVDASNPVNPTCNGGSDGSLDVTVAGGTAPFSYVWTNGAASEDISGLTADTYNVVVTDANGCTATLSTAATLTDPDPIVLTTPVVTNADCDSAETGTVQLAVTSGGTTPYTFTLSTGEFNTTGAFTTLAAGGYTYIVTDMNSCTAAGAFEVDDPNELELTVTSVIDEACNPNTGNNGSAMVTASGGTPIAGTTTYTFAWSGAGTQASTTANPNTVTNLVAGTYTVTVTDMNNCTEIETVVIGEPTLLIAEAIEVSGTTCADNNDGAATINATGGTTPYMYAWPATAGSVATSTVSNLEDGTYQVTVTDAKLCTTTVDVVITDGPTLVATINDLAMSCEVSSVGNISLDALFTATTTPGGIFTGTGVVGNTLQYNAPGCYEVTYTVTNSTGDADNCIQTDNAFISISEQAQPSFDIQNEVCLSAGDAAQIFTPNVSSPTYTGTTTELWTIADNVTGATATIVSTTGVVSLIPDAPGVAISGTYTITLKETISFAACGTTAAGSCEESFDVIVNVQDGTTLDASFTAVPNPVCAGDVVTLTPTTVGGVFTGTGVTDNGNGTGATFTSAFGGDFAVTYVLNSANGCTNSLTSIVTVNEDITIAQNFEVPTTACASGSNIDLTTYMLANDECQEGFAITASTNGGGGDQLQYEIVNSAGTVLFTSQIFGIPFIAVTDVHQFIVPDLTDTYTINPILGGFGETITVADRCTGTVLANGNSFFPINGLSATEICKAQVAIEWQTDLFPNEVFFNLVDGTGTVVSTFGPGLGSNGFPLEVLNFTADIADPSAGPYSLQVFDGFGDGTGTFTVTDVCSGTVLLGPIVANDQPGTSVGSNFEELGLVQGQFTSAITGAGTSLNSLGLGVWYADLNCNGLTGTDAIVGSDIDITQLEQSCFVNGLYELDVCYSLGDEQDDIASSLDNCNQRVCFTITIGDIDATIDVTDTTCPGASNDASDGALTVNPTGGTAPYTFHWSTGETTATITELTAGGYTVTVFDANGCSEVFAEEVVEDPDTAVPTVVSCPTALTPNVDAGQCGAVVTYAAPVFSDNCDGATLAGTMIAGYASGATFPVGATTVTWTYMDVADQGTATCTFTVTVTDNENPVANCVPGFNLDLDADGNANITVADINNNSTDNCGIATMTIDETEFDCSNLGENTVTLTVTDNNTVGLTHTCTTIVTIENEEQAAIATCPADMIVNTDTDLCTAVVTYITPTFNDGCGSAYDGTLTAGTASGTAYPLGTTLVTHTYTDTDAGYVVTCNFNVTVEDNQAPTFTCPDPQVLASCDATVPNLVALVTDAADACGIASTVQTPVAGLDVTDMNGNSFDAVVTVTDDNGNETACSVNVSVVDTTDPIAVCVPEFFLSLDDDGIIDITDASSIDNGSSDNCGPVSVSIDVASFDCTDVGANTVTLTATDPAGNTAICTTVVNVIDTTIPEAICQDATVSLDATGNVTIVPATVGAFAFDACNIAAVVIDVTTFTCANVGDNVVTLFVTDNNGNVNACTSTVTVEDNTAPLFSCPDAQTVTSCNGVMPDLVALVTDAADACGIATTVQTPLAGTDPGDLNGNTITAVVTVTDNNGNATSCDVVVTVDDGEDPVFVNCPTTMIMVANDVDECSGKVNWAIPVAMDDCFEIAVTQTSGPASGTVVAVGVAQTIIYTATDDDGNTATCEFEVMVIDTQDPAFDADIVMPADATAECSDIPEAFVLTNADVNDNCTLPDNLVIAFDEVSTQGADNTVCGPDGFYNYTITRTWTITDEADNVTTHVQTLTIVDTTAPVAVCQDVTIVLGLDGMASITTDDVDNGSSDNCAPASVLAFGLDNTEFTCNDVGTNDVTLTVTDPCLNESECTAVITVEENPLVGCTPEYDADGSDPCSCKDNATDLLNGQFDELITIIAPAGDTWNIVSSSGLFDVSSPAPPAAPTALSVAALANNGLTDGIDNDGDGDIDNAEEAIYYTLSGIHVDAIGYSMTVQSANFGTTFSFTNICHYPTIDFANVPNEVCLGTELTLELTEAFGGTGDTQFFVNGAALTDNVFNGIDWGLGTHTISATFDAGDPPLAFSSFTAGGVTTLPHAQTLAAAQADPGCTSEISTTINIVSTPSQVGCNDLINVSLGEDCDTEITPDMALEGSYGCFDDYIVTLTYASGQALSPANMVDETHIGETLTFNLSHPISGNVCWGTVSVEDKLAPTITCPADVTIACTEDVDNLTVTGSPVVTDCSAFTVDFYDAVSDNGACAAPITMSIVRTFVAVDAYGRADSCHQIINVERPDLTQVVFPTDVAFSCEQVDQFPNLLVGNPYTLGVLADHPDFPGIMNATGVTSTIELSNTGSGEPTINGLAIQGAGSCMLAVLESDELYDVCGASYEILRTWKVRDMCAPLGPNNPREMTQIVKVLDEIGPVITVENITVSANIAGVHPVPCTAAFNLPTASINDVCSDVVSIETIHPFGTNESNGGFIEGLEIGTHNITYVAEDACGNATTRTIVVTVVDDLAPTPVCDELTQVAIGGDGIAIVLADTFDDGSNDNCGVESFAVRRMTNTCDFSDDLTFGPSVRFCCDDIGTTVMVAFQVTDFHGNTNQCMAEVLVEDKLAPYKISDVLDDQVTCDDYFTNLAPQLDLAAATGETNPEFLNTLFGTPEYADNCAVNVTHSYVVDVNSCGEGAITRTWTVVDNDGNNGATCTQVIDVDHVNNWEIQFPADVNLTCEAGMNPDEDGDFGSPEIFFDDCELIAISIENTTYNVLPDACYKIIRTYTAINWCVYNGTNNSDNIDLGDNRFRDVADGIIVYTQNIKVVDDLAPMITCPTIPEYEVGIECLAEVILPQLTDIVDCSSDIDVTVVSALGTGYGSFNSAAIGTYTATYTATDNCGNTMTCESSFAVVDNKAPTPYCVGGLVIELMPVDTDGDGLNDNGMAQTWATDFDAGSFDNCTAQADLEFVVGFTSDINDANADGSLDLTCEVAGAQSVYLFVTDAAGNTDVCLTSLFVESVDNVCPSTSGPDEDDPVIAGTLATEYNVALESASVSLNTGMATTSDEEGAYSLTATAGTDVTVIPEHNVYDNSVTTIDLVFIRSHILTTQLLDSPYKIIAADVNGNGSVTAVDLVIARQKILGMTTSYPTNNAWVFVDASYEFPTDWVLSDGYPAVVNMNNITGNHDNVNFVAVRVGDVNESYGFAADADERNSFIIQTNDAQLSRGEQTTVSFATTQKSIGYQFTLNHSNMKVVSINGNAENFGVFNDAFTTSFSENATGELFTVTFEALEDVQLSEVLDLNGRITAAEAYNDAGAIMDIVLDFNDKDKEFALYQNLPNPFIDETMIGFNLPQDASVTFTVLDVNGRIIKLMKGDYSAGYNTLNIDNLDVSGVLYLQLETTEYTETIKMVKID